jgi:glycosyltransferase involved in cell wall biosynthesis
MIKKNDLVSVIIRTKDRPVFLQRAIDSVCSQDYENIELIIINDNGCDVVDVINHYKSVFKNVPGCKVKRDFIYINNTVSVMRTNAANIGLESARGKYICLLDDDDYFYSQHLSEHIKVQEKNSCLWSISRSFESLESENGIEKFKKYNYPSNINMVKFYFFENYFPSNSIVFQRKLIDKVGCFDKKLHVLEDWDLWIRMYMETEPYLIDEVTSVYTTRNGASNVRMSFELKGLWKDTFKMVMEKYKGVYKDEKVGVPLSEIDNFLSNHSPDWYHLVKENEELRDSFAYTIYRSKFYRIFKKIGRIFKRTRG